MLNFYETKNLIFKVLHKRQYKRFELCRSLPAGPKKWQYAANQQWKQHHCVGRRPLGQVPRGAGPAADPAEEGERRPKACSRVVSC